MGEGRLAQASRGEGWTPHNRTRRSRCAFSGEGWPSPRMLRIRPSPIRERVMRVDLFDFDLPDERIALRPASPRDAARMLVVRPGGEPELDDRTVRELPELLSPGDALVLNDTKVIPARLWGLRTRGEATARVEIMLHKR